MFKKPKNLTIKLFFAASAAALAFQVPGYDLGKRDIIQACKDLNESKGPMRLITTQLAINNEKRTDKVANFMGLAGAAGYYIGSNFQPQCHITRKSIDPYFLEWPRRRP